MKKLFLLFITAISLNSFSQLKVDNNGLVGIGTTSPNPFFNLTLGNPSKGGMIHSKGGSFFRAGQADGAAAVVGTSSDIIEFWYATSGHNVLNAQKFQKVSDSTLKTNIKPLRDGLATILELKTYSYDILEGDSATGELITEYGFLTQEVREVLPEVTDSSMGVLVMDYDQITPFLTDATQELYYENQEQGALIDSLVQKVSKLENELFGHDPTLSESVLYQNVPNPFKENTVIKYELPTEFSTAFIMLFNMNGAYIKQYEISGIGEGELTIEGETLEAGMYLYSLIVDDKEVDTKRLILQQ